MEGGRILVATDFSEGAAAAARWAAAAGDALGLPVAVTHVVEHGLAEWLSGAQAAFDEPAGRTAFETRIARWYADVTGGARATPDVRFGDCPGGLAEAAGALGAALLVMAASTGGPLRRVLVGSRLQQVANAPPCPLVIVREDAEPPRVGLRVAAGADFSPASDRAVALAAELAGRMGGSLDLVFVAEVPRSVAVIATLLGSEVTVEGVRSRGEMNLAALRDEIVGGAAPDVACRTHVPIGPTAETFAAFVRDNAVDLVVVGQAGAGARLPGLLGSTAHGLVQRLPAVLCIVPEPPRPRA
jgi:nucleotide-binding universal stress UspA family protein